MKQPIGPETQLTSHQVGKLLQVNPSSVNKWIKDGRMHAFRTPGGHHRVRAADLVRFLRAHEMRVPPELREAARRRILVLESEPKRRAALERQIAAREVELEARLVEHPIDALIELGAFAPHLVVLDLGAPGFDAFEVIERVRGRALDPSPEVLLSAPRLTPKQEKRAEVLGVRVVLKPVPVEILAGGA